MRKASVAKSSEAIRRKRSRAFVGPGVLAAIVLLTSCGGGGGGPPSQTPPPAPPQGVSISGVVTGQIVSGITISLSGPAIATTTTDANGNYSFPNLAAGLYTVTPSLGRATFNPRSRAITVAGANLANQNFAELVSIIGLVKFMPDTFSSSDQLRISLVPKAGNLYFTDSSSDLPLKKVNTANLQMTALAMRMGTPENVVVAGQNVFWVDGGNLNKTALDGTSTTILQAGQRQLVTGVTADIVTDSTSVYWANTVTSSSCSPSCNFVILKVPMAGGSPVTLASTTRSIVALASDANNIYWEESMLEPVSPGCQCGSSIKKVAKNGGAVTVLVDGLLNGPSPILGQTPASWLPTGGIATDGSKVYFAVAGNSSYDVNSVATSGGAVSTLATVPGGGVRNLSVDATNAYWMDLGSSTIDAVPLGGGAVTPLATGLTSPAALTIGAASAVWSEKGATVGCCLQAGAGSIKSAPLSGGAASTVVSALDAPGAVTLDASGDVVWVEAWRIGKLPPAGVPSTLASGISSNLARIAADNTNLYILDGAFIKKLPLLGGTVEKVVAANGGRLGDFSQIDQDIATDGVNVYWTVLPGGPSGPTVYSAPVAGGAVTTLATSGFVNPQDCYWRIAVDAHNVYWSAGSATFPIGCTINKVPIAGGPSTNLVDFAFLRDFVVDGTNVYFSELGTNPGSLRRVPVVGGPVTVVTTDTMAWVLAQDALKLYWMDTRQIAAPAGIFSIAKTGGPAGSATSVMPGPVATDVTLAAEGLVIDSGTAYWTESLNNVIFAQPVP